MVEKSESKTKLFLKTYGMIPFFNDFSVYENAMLISKRKDLRMSVYILEALNYKLKEDTKTELKQTEFVDFHNLIKNIGLKKSMRVADYIEYAVKDYNRKSFEEMFKK